MICEAEGDTDVDYSSSLTLHISPQIISADLSDVLIPIPWLITKSRGYELTIDE